MDSFILLYLIGLSFIIPVFLLVVAKREVLWSSLQQANPISVFGSKKSIGYVRVFNLENKVLHNCIDLQISEDCLCFVPIGLFKLRHGVVSIPWREIEGASWEKEAFVVRESYVVEFIYVHSIKLTLSKRQLEVLVSKIHLVRT